MRSVTGGADREVTFARNGISQSVIPTKLVYQQVKGGNLRLARQIELYELDGDHWWNLRVDATTGVILARSDYVSHADDAYRVFAIPIENPDDGARTLVMNPAERRIPARVAQQRGSQPSPRPRATTSWPIPTATPTTCPTPAARAWASPKAAPASCSTSTSICPGPPEGYQAAAVTNLFYWNNIIHDVLYGYGFDEKSGNFQFNNFGPNAGKGGDPVRAEAQDGSGRNNANFATPPDGFAPRMQMFEWRDSEPNPLTVEGVGTVLRPHGRLRRQPGHHRSDLG